MNLQCHENKKCICKEWNKTNLENDLKNNLSYRSHWHITFALFVLNVASASAQHKACLCLNLYKWILYKIVLFHLFVCVVMWRTSSSSREQCWNYRKKKGMLWFASFMWYMNIWYPLQYICFFFDISFTCFMSGWFLGIINFCICRMRKFWRLNHMVFRHTLYIAFYRNVRE